MRAKSGKSGKMSSIFNTTDFSSTFEGGNKIKKVIACVNGRRKQGLAEAEGGQQIITQKLQK